MSNIDLVNKIKPYIGKEVGTFWGTADVKGFITDKKGVATHVELIDLDGDDLVIEIESFFDCLQ